MVWLPKEHTGLRFGLPDHLTTTGQASGQANYYMVKQVAKTTSWSGVGGQASGPANFRRGLAKNFACGARNPGGRPPDPPRSSNPTKPQIEALLLVARRRGKSSQVIVHLYG